MTTGASPTVGRHTRRRSLLVLAAVVVAGILAGLALATSGGRGRPSAAPSMPSHEKVQMAIASGKLLFVGASYTVGLGATTPTAGYAPVLAHQLDRRFTVAAVSGTGFLCPGKHHQGTFAERMSTLPPDLDPRIVVIQGGRNDVAYPPAQIQSAARMTIRMAQQRYPHAQVVVMGPIPAYVPVSPRLLTVRDVVRAASKQVGAGFVDPIAERWINPSNEHQYAGPVPFHPNDAGYRYIAGRLLGDLPGALEHSRAPLAVKSAPPAAPGGGAAGGAGGGAPTTAPGETAGAPVPSSSPADVAVPAQPAPVAATPSAGASDDGQA